MSNNNDGEIQVIYGPMFSGKSTELLRRIRRYRAAKKACLVVKYHLDLRYSSDSISTHDKATCVAHHCSRLDEMNALVNDVDVIAIDEGQFFPDLIDFCESMANRGKIVIVAALDGNFKRCAFNRVVDLLPMAEQVVKLNAVCVYTVRVMPRLVVVLDTRLSSK